MLSLIMLDDVDDLDDLEDDDNVYNVDTSFKVSKFTRARLKAAPPAARSRASRTRRAPRGASRAGTRGPARRTCAGT